MADAKVLDGSIMVDESQLTGEADEIPKGENQKLMSGSFVISGQASCRLGTSRRCVLY